MLAFDPGFTRLRLGLRASLSAAASTAVLYECARLVGLPPSDALLGIIIPMMGAVLITDPSSRDQKITFALVPVVAVVMATIGTVLAPSRVANTIGFAIVIFCAVYARTFRQRGTALGMIAFMTYFFAVFFHAPIAELPIVLASVVLGAAVTYVVRFVVLPDHPRAILAESIEAFRARASSALGAIVRAVALSSTPATRRSARGWRRVHARLAALNESALAMEEEVGESRADADCAAVDQRRVDHRSSDRSDRRRRRIGCG